MGGVLRLALALGPTVGGAMVEHLGWQSIFFLNVPIGVLAFLAATPLVPSESLSCDTRCDSPHGFREVDASPQQSLHLIGC